MTDVAGPTLRAVSRAGGGEGLKRHGGLEEILRRVLVLYRGLRKERDEASGLGSQKSPSVLTAVVINISSLHHSSGVSFHLKLSPVLYSNKNCLRITTPRLCSQTKSQAASA